MQLDSLLKGHVTIWWCCRTRKEQQCAQQNKDNRIHSLSWSLGEAYRLFGQRVHIGGRHAPTTGLYVTTIITDYGISRDWHCGKDVEQFFQIHENPERFTRMLHGSTSLTQRVTLYLSYLSLAHKTLVMTCWTAQFGRIFILKYFLKYNNFRIALCNLIFFKLLCTESWRH